MWLGNGSPFNGLGVSELNVPPMCIRFVLKGPLPKNLPAQAVATWTDGTTASFAGLSAGEAFAIMSRRTPEMIAADCAYVPPLVINGARLGTFGFETDRGTAQMTAWLFAAIGVNGEFAYPALAPAAFWKGGMIAQLGNGGATVSADGRSLTWSFTGVPDTAGPCGATYKGLVAESSSAVAVALQTIPNAPQDTNAVCPMIAQVRSIIIPLASPLGGRVVVDAMSNAVPICPATPKPC